jgi:hypothetical protein
MTELEDLVFGFEKLDSTQRVQLFGVIYPNLFSREAEEKEYHEVLELMNALEDTEIDKIVREMKIKGCPEEVAQIGKRYNKLHPRYKAKIGQQFFPEYELTQTKVIRSKTRPASASEALHVCKNVPAWGLHSIEGEDLTPPVPATTQTLTQRRNQIFKETPILRFKIKEITERGEDPSTILHTLNLLLAEGKQIDKELKKFK